ncbi:MAG: hypothetical protein WC915_02705 [archaeon]|jgi:hypothetical protein
MDENEFVVFWAKKCRDNMQSCQRESNKLVDSQIELANAFYKRIGRKKALRILNNLHKN